MVKKKTQLGLISLFSSSTTSASSGAAGLLCPSSSFSSISMSSSSWQWPSCKQPRTLSFRQYTNGDGNDDAAMMTMNSAYFPDSTDSCSFSNSFASRDTLSTASETTATVNEHAEAEAILRALRSGRLFFDASASPPTCSSARLIKKKKKALQSEEDGKKQAAAAAFDGATAMCMESSNPYRDFRASMEAMVMSHCCGGAKDWRWLEEMLGWYLRANGKSTHGLIVGAFVDLLVELTATPTVTATATPSSPTNDGSSSSNCSSFSGIVAFQEIKEEEDEEA